MESSSELLVDARRRGCARASSEARATAAFPVTLSHFISKRGSESDDPPSSLSDDSLMVSDHQREK